MLLTSSKLEFHCQPPAAGKRIFVIGDLNIDNVAYEVTLGQNAPANSELRVGGTGWNAALAFKNAGFYPIVFGKIGEDVYGRMVRNELEKNSIPYILAVSSDKPTGLCNIVNFVEGDAYRTIFYNAPNANDYDTTNLYRTLQELNITSDDYIFLATYIFPQTAYDLQHCRAFCEALKQSLARVIIDIVPHDLYENLALRDFLKCLSLPIYLLIAELRTLHSFVSPCGNFGGERPSDADYLLIVKSFESDFYAIRYGTGEISRQSTLTQFPRGDLMFLQRDYSTGFEIIPQTQKRGFGDTLTAELLKSIPKYEKKRQSKLERD